MDITLDMIDQVRQRAGVGYQQAREILERTGGNLVDSLASLEENLMGGKDEGATGKMKGMLSRLGRARLRINVKEHSLLELPVLAGAIGTVMFPRWVAWGILGILVSEGKLEVIQDVSDRK